jgi:DHA3 family tetracycline resistance protein-like MFS transporter
LYSLISAVSSIYAITVAQLTPLQLVLVGTILEASIFVFEIPTGVVADLVSRRVSVIIGVLLIGIGFIVWGSWTEFATILLAQFLWGVGYTFTRGFTGVDQRRDWRGGLPTGIPEGIRYGQYASLAGVGWAVLLARTSLESPSSARGGFPVPGAGVDALDAPKPISTPSRGRPHIRQQFFHTIRQGRQADFGADRC